MSIPVSVMTGVENGWSSVAGAHGGRPRPVGRLRLIRRQPFLTVPLLCSVAWSGFQSKRMHQVERRLAQGQSLDARPQVDDVALLTALLVEALEDVVVQVHAERPAAGVAAMKGTGAAALRVAAAQTRGQTELLEDARQRQLLFEMGEVEVGTLANLVGFGL